MKIPVLILIFGTSLAGCKSIINQSAPPDSSRTSIDWPGAYVGTLPCDNCEGTQIQVQLRSDNTFELMTRKIGKSEDTRSSGKIEWDQSGGIVTLGNKDQQFRVGENRLFKLDKQGHRIEGPEAEKYVLLKNTFDDKITEKYWRLVELNGRSVVYPVEQQRETHMILKEQENRVTGHGGCNSFFGSYEINGTTIRFSNIGSTRLACANLNVESAFFRALEQADNFTMKGDTLWLNTSHTERIAKFVVVYLR